MSTSPVRTCVGCRKRSARTELLRVVAEVREDGVKAVPDPTRRAPGRGANLHPTPECLDLALRRRAFVRALRVPNGIDNAAVREYVEQHGA